MRTWRSAVIVLAFGLWASACATRPAAERAGAPAPPAAAEPSPFTDRELMDELARQGVGQETPAGEELQTEIRETPRGVVITFRQVFFAFDSADLTPVARQEVERMAAVLNHPRAIERRIALEGHTDAIGTEQYNLELSRRRASAVAQEIVARGVRRDRLTVRGFGKQRPVAPDTLPDGTDNPAGRARNRRVEAVLQPSAGSTR